MNKRINHNTQIRLENSNQKFAFTILDTAKSEDGQYIPCIVKEGEGGYYLTDWTWGKDKRLAVEMAKERNETMGIDEKTALRLVCESMFKYTNSYLK